MTASSFGESNSLDGSPGDEDESELLELLEVLECRSELGNSVDGGAISRRTTR